MAGSLVRLSVVNGSSSTCKYMASEREREREREREGRKDDCDGNVYWKRERSYVQKTKKRHLQASRNRQGRRVLPSLPSSLRRELSRQFRGIIARRVTKRPKKASKNGRGPVPGPLPRQPEKTPALCFLQVEKGGTITITRWWPLAKTLYQRAGCCCL